MWSPLNIKLVCTAHNWNVGILEYWNNGFGGILSIKKWFFPIWFPTIPSFHHSIIPDERHV